MENKKTKATSLALIRRLLTYVKPHRKLFWIVMAAVTVANAFELARPKVLGWIIDQFSTILEDSNNL